MVPDRLTAALVALSDDDLRLLRELADDAMGPNSGILAAISHAADWELHRRGGIDFERLPLVQAIDPADLDAALTLGAGLADRLGDVPSICALVAAVVAEITDEQRRH
jgi:hypothetical protein